MMDTSKVRERVSGLRARWAAQDRRSRVNTGIAAFALLLIIVISAAIPQFLTRGNIANLFEQISTLGLMATGMTCVLIVGGIDLSMPSVLAASAVVGATYMANGGGAVVGCLLMFLVALVFGCINGLAVAKGKMIPFIVTLSTMFVGEGFAVMYTEATSVYGLPATFQRIGAKAAGIPLSAALFLAVALLVHLMTSRTKLGRWYYLTGVNEGTARISGIPTDLAKFSAYVLSALMAGLAAVILTARLNSATSSMVGDTMIMDAISASVIGGASLSGGKGNIIGALLGVLFITVISNCINLLGISYYIGMMIKGVIIVIVIALDVLRAG